MSDFKPHPLFSGARTVKRNATTNTLVQVGKASADFTIPYNNSSLEVVASGDFATIYNLNPVWIYMNAKNGTFLPPVEYDFDFSSGAGFQTGGGGIGIADINGDGYPDLVGVAFDPGYNSSYVAQTTVSVLGMLNKGDGTLAAALPEQTTVFNGSIHSDLGQVVLADMNKDGKVDLILTASGDDNLGQHQPVHHGSADCHKLTSLARHHVLPLPSRSLCVAHNLFALIQNPDDLLLGIWARHVVETPAEGILPGCTSKLLRAVLAQP